MLLANPKTLAAMKAKEIEAGKGGGKAGAKKDLKSDSKDALSSLPNIADLLQLSADSAVAAPGMGIDFATSPVQQQQSSQRLRRWSATATATSWPSSRPRRPS